MKDAVLCFWPMMSVLFGEIMTKMLLQLWMQVRKACATPWAGCVYQRAAGEQLNAEGLVWGLDLAALVCLSSYLEFRGTSGVSACEVLLSLPCLGVLSLLHEPLVHLPWLNQCQVPSRLLVPRRGLLGLILGWANWGGSSCSGSFCWLSDWRAAPLLLSVLVSLPATSC